MMFFVSDTSTKKYHYKENTTISHFVDIHSQFKDRNCLLAALLEMGWTIDQLEVHNSPQYLYGYKGDRRNDIANIIIRKNNVGIASNDIGFRLEIDGTYTAIISEYDRSKYSDDWLNKLKQSYSVQVTLKQAKLKGMTVKKSVKADGTIAIVLMKGT